MSIFVTRPFVPKKRSLNRYFNAALKNRQLSNNGPMVQELTERLQDYLGVKNLLLVANGTLALQIAVKLFKLRGNVYTTPFTFPATSSALFGKAADQFM